jgi:hypothetical protein
VTIKKEEEESNTKIALSDEDTGSTSENLRVKQEEVKQQNSLTDKDSSGGTKININYLGYNRNVSY